MKRPLSFFSELLEGYIQKSPNGLVFEDFVEQLKKVCDFDANYIYI